MPTPHSDPGAKLAVDHPFFDLVEEAYRVFQVPKPTSLGVCEHCCMDPAIEADFLRPPIAALPLGYLRDWYQAAYDPAGIDQAIWTYLLPRVLEVLAAGEDASPTGLEVSLSRFATGDASRWSQQQWSVLERFQRRFLDRELRSASVNALDDVLCMFRLAEWPLDDLLRQVAEVPDESLIERLWRDWCDVIPGRERVWITAFWEGPDRGAVFGFYTSPELHTRMVTVALADDVDPVLAEKATAVASVIEANAD